MAYARYANIYKDHAAETYASSIEVSRRGRGPREAYRRRVVAASTDAGRYTGYVETDSTPRDDCGGVEGGGMGPPLLLEAALGGSGSVSSGFVSSSGLEGGVSSDSGAEISRGDDSSLASSSRFGSCSGFGGESPSATVAAAAGKRVEMYLGDGGEEGRRGDGAASECSAFTGGGSEIHAVSGPSDFAEGGDAAAAARGGGVGAFVDVVQFNNIRAKYLRPWDDTKLSGMYHVPPSPDWRANRTPGSRGGIGGSSTAASAEAIAASVGSGRTMEAYRRTRQIDPTARRRRSRTLNLKDRKAWGAH